MRKYLSHAYILIAVAAIAFGLIGIVAGGFLKNFVPVPESMSGSKILLYLVSLAFIAPGIGMLIPKTKYSASIALGVVFLLLYLILHLVKLLGNIYDPGFWAASSEMIALACGAIFAAQVIRPGLHKAYLTARYIFTLAFAVFGIQHFMYAGYIASLIPNWLPARLFLAYFVGVVFLSTALSLFLSWQSQLFTFLLGAMLLIFVIILHAPRVIASPGTEPEWVSLFVALAMCGTAFSLSAVSTKAAYSVAH